MAARGKVTGIKTRTIEFKNQNLLKRQFTTLTIYLVFAQFVIGQNAEPIIIELTFSGLKKTSATYLSRFLKTEVGQEFQYQSVQEDVQNLKNLTSVSDAKWSLDTLPQGLLLTYEIEEALTFFPIVSFGSVSENLWFQLGFTDVNWRGKGNQLTVYYLNNDKRHNAALYYRVPYWKGSPWGTTFNFLRWASVEPTFFDEGTVIYNYDFMNFGSSVIYEFKQDHTIELGANYFKENYNKIEEQPLSDPPGPNGLSLPKFLFKATHYLSQIDYHNYYLDGWDNNLQTESVYNLNGGDWFHVLKNDTRFFRRIGKKGNFAARARLGFSTNVNTPFAPFVLDSQINIRGAGNRRDRGTAAAVLNLEYRQTIYDIGGKFAAQLVGFSDIGTWREPGGELVELVSDDSLQFFSGLGFRLIYKKAFNAMLRIDYGIDIFNANQRGLVLGAGQYF